MFCAVDIVVLCPLFLLLLSHIHRHVAFPSPTAPSRSLPSGTTTTIGGCAVWMKHPNDDAIVHTGTMVLSFAHDDHVYHSSFFGVVSRLFLLCVCVCACSTKSGVKGRLSFIHRRLLGVCFGWSPEAPTVTVCFALRITDSVRVFTAVGKTGQGTHYSNWGGPLLQPRSL